MNKEFEEGLFAIEPAFFERTSARTSLMYFGFDCGDGWFVLIRELILMAKWSKDHPARILVDGKYLVPEECPPDNSEHECERPWNHFQILQVKEKFGTLRFYTQGGAPEYDGAITLAERLSATMCEVCGKPGSLDQSRNWVRTLCDEHKKV